jgi:phosphate transport system permease protein
VTPESVPQDSGDQQPLPLSERWKSGLARWWPYAPALIPVALTAAIVGSLVGASAFHNFGWGFFSFNIAKYGILIFVVGSFLTSLPALLLAMLIGLGIAVASTTYLPGWLAAWLDPFVDLLAGIPSIIYGLWGFLILAPFFGHDIFPWLAPLLAWIPGFHTAVNSPSREGTGLALAIVILTLMILPITTLLMRDALRSVPKDLWESGLALGATRLEVASRVAIPYSKRGIWGAAFLGFGRAFGETVAVFMVINQFAELPTNVYSKTSTMASLIISDINDSLSGLALSYLAEIALVLLAITLAVNIAGRWMIRRTFTDVAGV